MGRIDDALLEDQQDIPDEVRGVRTGLLNKTWSSLLRFSILLTPILPPTCQSTQVLHTRSTGVILVIIIYLTISLAVVAISQFESSAPRIMRSPRPPNRSSATRFPLRTMHCLDRLGDQSPH